MLHVVVVESKLTLAKMRLNLTANLIFFLEWFGTHTYVSNSWRVKMALALEVWGTTLAQRGVPSELVSLSMSQKLE